MNTKLKKLEEKLPKNCCSFCTHMSLVGPSSDFTYDIKCVILDDLPDLGSSCKYFHAEHTYLNANDLDKLYISFLENCLRVDFDEYKKSLYWNLIKEKALNNYKKCHICSSNENLDVKHINKNLGRESLKDLIVLCDNCYHE